MTGNEAFERTNQRGSFDSTDHSISQMYWEYDSIDIIYDEKAKTEKVVVWEETECIFHWTPTKLHYDDLSSVLRRATRSAWCLSQANTAALEVIANRLAKSIGGNVECSLSLPATGKLTFVDTAFLICWPKSRGTLNDLDSESEIDVKGTIVSDGFIVVKTR